MMSTAGGGSTISEKAGPSLENKEVPQKRNTTSRTCDSPESACELLGGRNIGVTGGHCFSIVAQSSGQALWIGHSGCGVDMVRMTSALWGLLAQAQPRDHAKEDGCESWNHTKGWRQFPGSISPPP